MSELALTGSAGTLPATAKPATGPAGAVLQRIKAFTAQPAVAKSLPMLAIGLALAFAALAYFTLSTPPQKNLFSGLGDADKAAVVDQLKSAGIAYRIDSDTGSITVGESQYYQAKMLLAQQGLPKSAPDGDAVLSAMPMGASRAVEGERLRGAREMDLARTIEAIDAVEKARIHLAVEQPSVFLRDAKPAAASVMLTLRNGRALSEGQVQAIVNLVASSVPGLSPEGVSVVDQAGHLLSKQGGAAGGAMTQQVELQAQIEQRYRDALNKLLAPLVGADGFTAEVHADLDWAEVQATRESYPNKPGAIAAEQGGWQNDAAKAGPPGGIPGAIANEPPAPATASSQAPGQIPGVSTPPAAPAIAQGEAGKTSETYNRQFNLDHEVSVTKNPVGTVRRLSVAVALKQDGKPRGVAETKALEDLIKGAVGFDQQRGDLIAVTNRAFATPEAPEAAKWYEASWVAMAARQGGAVLVALILVLGVVRPMMKRRSVAAKEAAALIAAPAAGSAQAEAQKAAMGAEIAAAIASDSRENPAHPVTLEMIEAAPGYADRAQLIRNFVRQDPARAALVVRDLIRADLPQGEKRDG
ncbi:flagellar basal-body MS-ring/collar protein FliF [Sphingomonas naphthae]|uniref:Flagellar M-ring protein n=1 Tax=Sphingomonas naphthae TaxID=1813468 RepID=A0ABY7TIY8_9SPHN|nr:flagellar basal-body MS-ring/collar protein FliF [Sphingomonas naphthae]WCT72900.1 flagellar basal-body MS-ring/collar protein FliF [Sphingomonas naphthae]